MKRFEQTPEHSAETSDCDSNGKARRSVFDEYHDQLDDATFMLGKGKGHLAVTLDILTDALVTTGMHAIHCRHPRKQDEPSEDLQTIVRNIEDAKLLIQRVMSQLNESKK